MADIVFMDYVHSAFKTHLQAMLPADVKVGYGDMDTVYRKVIDCKQRKNLPIFGITIKNISQYNAEASTPLVRDGYPDNAESLPVAPVTTMAGVRMMVCQMQYDCFYLTNQQVALGQFVQTALFANYEADKSFFNMADPEIADPNATYDYTTLFSDNYDYEKKGNEYEMGYQFFVRCSVTLTGPLRKLRTDKVVKDINMKIYFNNWLAADWDLT
jgi:hypothetical protein